MSYLDSEFYAQIDDPSSRIAIIYTDYTQADTNSQRMEKDVANVEIMLKQLGFTDETILKIDRKGKNVLTKQVTDFCTLKANTSLGGYIIMFNFTYKEDNEHFRAKTSWYNSEYLRQCFVGNNLISWRLKPKLIFYQTPLLKQSNQSIDKNKFDNGDDCKNIEVPIDANIFQSFSNDGNEDSYGDENGSFYIQALCETIGQHVEDKMIQKVDLIQIIYEMHDKIYQKLSDMPQTPRFKSTFIKKFAFP